MAMVLNMFGRREVGPSEESKAFLNSLPSTFINLFRKRRQFFPIWTSHKYCAMIKSTYLVYYRVSKSDDSNDRSHKYINLINCTIKMIDDDAAGYVFCITPENGKTPIYFAADNEKDRAKFARHAADAQRQTPNVSDYETLKLLGKGHYGRVILARNRRDNQVYAVKEMKLHQVKPKVVYTERSVMEWVAEHPFILSLDYAFIEGRSAFLISRFMPGGDLFLLMQNNGGCFNEEAVRFYGAELILALEHMHAMNILHRDIKPENVLLDFDGHIKLADMGLAKRLDSKGGRTRTMCGTDTYLPPEMVSRSPAGHGLAVDLWQLGCILFELRAGYPPFYIPQSSQKSTHQRILYQSIRYPNNLSKEFKGLLMQLLGKRQEDRLGYDGGIGEVKKHSFFRTIDWEKAYKKQLAPPLVPGPPGDAMVNNFDPQFTQQPHKIQVTDDISGAYERDFAGFEYVRQPADPLTSKGSNVSAKDTCSTEADEKPELEVESLQITI